MAKISVIITSYNVESYISRCIESICKQTIKDIEIIIVDDGSNDGTKDIINKLKSKDRRIETIFFEKNSPGGVGSAANAGIKIAKGDYIGFADGDDWYEPNMYENLYNLANKNDVDIAVGNYKEFDDLTAQFKTPSDTKKWPKYITPKKIQGVEAKKLILKLNPVPWRKLYKKKFIVDNGIFFPEGDFFFEDNPFHWETTIQSNSFILDSNVYCYHRVNRKGQTMLSKGLELLAMYSHHITILNYIKEIGMLESYEETLCRWFIVNSEWISKRIQIQYRHSLFLRISSNAKLHSDLDVKKMDLNEKAKGMLLAAIRGSEKKYYHFIDPLSWNNFFTKLILNYKKEGLIKFSKNIVKKLISMMPFLIRKNILRLKARFIKLRLCFNSIKYIIDSHNNLDKKNSIISLYMIEELNKKSEDA